MNQTERDPTWSYGRMHGPVKKVFANCVMKFEGCKCLASNVFMSSATASGLNNKTTSAVFSSRPWKWIGCFSKSKASRILDTQEVADFFWFNNVSLKIRLPDVRKDLKRKQNYHTMS